MVVIVSLDIQSLPLGHFLSQIVSSLHVLGRKSVLVEVPIDHRYTSVGHGEVRVQLHRPLEERKRGGCSLCQKSLCSPAIGPLGLQARRPWPPPGALILARGQPLPPAFFSPVVPVAQPL